MYIHGLNQYADQPANPSQDQTWLDYLILSNPQGVMKVLANHGYTGYLAPMGQDEMGEATLELIEKKGDAIVVELLREHPLFDVISDICKEEISIKVPFKNAAGDISSITTTIRTINYKKLAESALVIIGVFFLAGKVWGYLTKSE